MAKDKKARNLGSEKHLNMIEKTIVFLEKGKDVSRLKNKKKDSVRLGRIFQKGDLVEGVTLSILQVTGTW